MEAHTVELSAHDLVVTRLCRIQNCPNDSNGRARSGRFKNLCDHHWRQESAKMSEPGRAGAAARWKREPEPVVRRAAQPLFALARKLDTANVAVYKAEWRRAKALAEFKAAYVELGRAAGLIPGPVAR